MFFLLPFVAFLISIVSTIALTVIVILGAVGLAFLLTVNSLREVKPEILPERLKSWKWLPLFMRSLGKGYHEKVNLRATSVYVIDP
jgi:hypothetical protein